MNRQAIRAILERIRIAQYTDNPEESCVLLNPVNRQALIDYLDVVQEHQKGKGAITIRMPCGNEKEFVTHGDIPLGDLPCPCGRDNHYFVKYSPNPLGLNELTYIT